MRCPKCRSNKLIKFGWKLKSHRIRLQQYQCKNCGKITTKPKGNIPDIALGVDNKDTKDGKTNAR